MAEEPKKKFAFNCTKCGKCCLDRGPIPLVMEDLEMWAKNNVVNNFLPYLKFIKTPFNTIDLVLARTDKNPFGVPQEEEKKKEEDVDLSCPMYNKEKNECLIYENRPMSCGTYPLEFDGENYQVVDVECPGVGNGEMTKEDRKALRDNAKQMNISLTRMRTVMPILSQAMQPFVINQLMEAQKQYMDAMEKMSPEEREKVQKEMDEQMKKQK
jgi:Fe-S-cluster containining protein